MEIYQDDSSAHTPGRHLRSTRKPLTPHNHQTPMQAFRQSLKDATNSNNTTSVKKTKKNVLFQASVGVHKENKSSMATTPTSAQSFRRSLRGNGSKLLGGRRLSSTTTAAAPTSLALGPPKRVIPKTPNSLLRGELDVDDSMEDDSFLVSPPPGALWNRLDPSTTSLVVVSPQAAAHIHQTLSSKKQAKESPLFSPPLQPRKLATNSTDKKKTPSSASSMSSKKGQWFSLEQSENTPPPSTSTDKTTPIGSAIVDLSSAFSSTETSTKKKTPPPHLLERLKRGTKSSQIKKDLPQAKKTNGLAMDFTDLFSPKNDNEKGPPHEDLFTPRPTSAKKETGLMDFTHLFSDSKLKKSSPPPKLVERLQNATRKRPASTTRSTNKLPPTRAPSTAIPNEKGVSKAKRKESSERNSRGEQGIEPVEKPATTAEIKATGLVDFSDVFSDTTKKETTAVPPDVPERVTKLQKRSPNRKQQDSEATQSAGSPILSKTKLRSFTVEKECTPPTAIEKNDTGLVDYSHVFSGSKKSRKASPPLNLAKRLQQPRKSNKKAVKAASESKSLSVNRAVHGPRTMATTHQQNNFSTSASGNNRPALPRTENKSPKTRRAPKVGTSSFKESIKPSPLIKRPGKYGEMATPSSRRYASLATPTSHRRRAETSKNVEVNEWAEKQSETFVNWLNYTLHPSEEDEHQGARDMTDADSPSCSGLRMLLIHRRLAQSRMKASGVFYGDRMQKVKSKIHSEIARGRLAIRPDRDVYYDLSLRRQITALLQSYTTPWLRLGLEVMFGECVAEDNSVHDPSKSHFSRMRSVLGKFIVDRVLSDSAVLTKYTKGKCKIPSGRFEKQFRAEMRSLVVYRIMVLIIFLDEAKKENVLDKVPRLFAKDSEVKSSREVLLALCRACLSSEGDFIKHLSRIGLKVSYKQDPVDELDFYVRNLAIDLRDGSSLSRVTEIITQVPTKSIMTKLRLPSISRLQKLHNLNLTMASLRKFGVMIPDDVNAHHIVDGHRDMVLKVMWSLIAHSCMEKLLEGNLVEQEISNVVRSSRARRMILGLVPKASVVNQHPVHPHDSSPEEVLKSLLFRWCQAVCSSFGVTLNDFTTSFADGRALCLLVHYYHPAIIRQDEILSTSSDNVQGLSEEQTLRNERANCTMASRRASQLGGIPKMIPCCDSKNPPNERSMLLCLTYLCSRLMESSKEIFATILIQQSYRKYREKVDHEKKQEAALIIFDFWLKHKEYYFSTQKRCYQKAVAVVETFFLSNRQAFNRAKLIRIEKAKQWSAAINIQRVFRGGQDRARYYELSQEFHASIRIQCFFRVSIAKHIALDRLQKQGAASCIQRSWRGFLSRQRYGDVICSAIKIQSLARGMIVRGQVERKEQAAFVIQQAWWNFVNSWRMNWSATTIQSMWRVYRARLIFEQKLLDEEEVNEKAAMVIQGAWRAFSAQVQFQLHLLDVISVQSLARRRMAMQRRNDVVQSVAVLQGAVRCWLARWSLGWRIQEKKAAVTCQCAVRCWLSKQELSSRERKYISATRVQTYWRMYSNKMAFRQLAVSTILIQASFRGHHDRQGIECWGQSAALIQRTWRSFSRDLQKESACVGIQRTWRAHFCRKKFCSSLASAAFIQRCWRGYAVRSTMEKRQFAATILQGCWRGFIGRMNFQLDLLEIIFVQNAVRRFLAMRHAAARCEAIQVIQNALRRCLAVKATNTLKQERIEWQIEHHAAVYIQSSIRCYLTQKDCRRKMDAAVVLQSWRRSQTATRNFQGVKICVVFLQARVRGRTQRRRISLLHEKASIIQGHWRCFTLCIKYRLLIGDIITVQSVVRCYLANQSSRNQSIAATKIQSLVRGNVVRDSLEIYHFHASVIQSVVRGFKARISYTINIMDIVIIQSLTRRWLARQIAEERRSSVQKIQNSVRGWIACRLVSDLRIIMERERVKSKMACKIQAFYHGCKTRRTISIDIKGATSIQASFRRFKSRKRFLGDRMNVVVVQSVVRRWLVGRFMLLQTKAVEKIQSIVRRRKACQKVADLKMVQSLVYRQSRAATIIQSAWRGHCGRKLASKHAAARKIQKTWRCFVTHIDFLVQVMSVLSIQASVRRLLAQRSFDKRYQSLVKLQAFSRGSILRWKSREEHHAAVVIQSAYRSNYARRAFHIEKYAATTIQRVVRGFFTRINIDIEHFAAAEIQRVWRGYNQFVEYVYIVFAVIKIQSHMRRCLARNKYERLQLEIWAERSYLGKKASIIQHAYREAVLRRKMFRAAATIQSAFREYLAQWRANMFSRATIRLQAAFRGQAIRRKRSRSVAIVARKVLRAKQRAMKDPTQRLGCRTSSALTVLETSTSLAEIMGAVKTLESSTRLSVKCCEVFTDAQASKILLDLIRACNRSLPHVELVHWILLTLENVGRHDQLLHCFSDCKSAEVFLDKVQMFRDKDGIFCLSVSLLNQIVYNDQTVLDFCGTHEHLKRLKGIHKLSMRRTHSVGGTEKGRKKRLQQFERREIFDRPEALNVLGELIKYIEVPVETPMTVSIERHFTF